MTISSSLRGLACAALAFSAGCASSADGTNSGAVNTGTYPNLNVAPPVAATQFTPYSLAQHNARLASAKQQQDGQTVAAEATISQSQAEAARLRQLRGRHGDATLNDIESASTATPPATN